MIMRKIMLLVLLFVGVLISMIWVGTVSGQQPASLPATKVNQKDGAEMALIPAGEFMIGITEDQITAWIKDHPDDARELFADQMPQHSVYLGDYYMYKTEVTVAQYRQFCTATGRRMPAAPRWGWIDTHPISNVSWNDAAAYAKWAGGVLPTEAEWEKAARGTDGRLYPWGNRWDASRCQCSKEFFEDAEKTAPVGSFPAGASPYGVLDMAGNVAEWCADWYSEDYYHVSPAKNPPGPGKNKATVISYVEIDGQVKSKGRVVRDGYWGVSNPGIFVSTLRNSMDPKLKLIDTGFRCVLRSSKK